MISKTIWQTYETPIEDLPLLAQQSLETWKSLNPGWDHGYMSGADREDFFRTEFGGEVFDTYMKYPLGVMKAGLWRFAILYKNGGVYADLDTECINPIDTWLDQKYDMILDLEGNTPWYATQVIASSKGHHLYWGDGRLENYVAWKKDSIFENLTVEDVQESQANNQ